MRVISALIAKFENRFIYNYKPLTAEEMAQFKRALAEAGAGIICEAAKKLLIPPGALLRANPALFLQVKLSCDMTKDDWHAFYDRLEAMRGRWDLCQFYVQERHGS